MTIIRGIFFPIFTLIFIIYQELQFPDALITEFTIDNYNMVMNDLLYLWILLIFF